MYTMVSTAAAMMLAEKIGEPLGARCGGWQIIVRCPVSGGDAISIITNGFSYGGDLGLWEAAVMSDNEVVGDPEGYMTDDEVIRFVEVARAGGDPINDRIETRLQDCDDDDADADTDDIVSRRWDI